MEAKTLRSRARENLAENWGISIAVALVTSLLGGLLTSALGSSLGMSLFCLMLFALEKKLTVRALPAILLFSLFMLTWFPINLACFFTRPPKWESIRHTVNRTVPM